MGLDELRDWLREQAAKEGRWAYSAQMKSQRAQAATHIGRQWAFLRVLAKLDELVTAAMCRDDLDRALAENDDQRDYAEERFNAGLMRED